PPRGGGPPPSRRRQPRGPDGVDAGLPGPGRARLLRAAGVRGRRRPAPGPLALDSPHRRADAPSGRDAVGVALDDSPRHPPVHPSWRVVRAGGGDRRLAGHRHVPGPAPGALRHHRRGRHPLLGRRPLPQRLEPGGGHVSAQRSGSLLTLATLSVVATLGFARLFGDASWVLPVMLAAIGAHGVGLATRRWPAPLALSASALAMGLLLCAVVAGHSTFYGLPTASTLSALGRAWTAGLDSFRNAVAPTKVTPGLLLLSVGGTWVCAAAADWLAFRGDATLTAILPPFVLYVMG